MGELPDDEEDFPPPPPDADAIRQQSQDIIKRLGGRWLDRMPYIEYFEPRQDAEAIARLLAMIALQQISEGAPLADTKEWIAKHELSGSLSPSEKRILAEPEVPPTKRQMINLSWYVEGIAAFFWAGGMTGDLMIEQSVDDIYGTIADDIRLKDGRSALEGKFQLRAKKELYQKLDLYYLAHWYARDGKLNGYSTEPFNLSTIIERRKSLEWLNNRALDSWDEITLDT